jgi:L-cysteine desulfidase
MGLAMHQTLPDSDVMSDVTSKLTSARSHAASLSRLIVAAIGATVAAMLAAAVLLWFHYGTAVFYDMILSGISACF